MADRLTQLQDAVNQKTSVTVLVFSNKFPDRGNGNSNGQSSSQEDFTMTFALLIARCAKDIDYLIESLPSEDSSTELQLASLRRLEQENNDAALKLKEVIKRGESLLERIQLALQDISQTQLDMQKLDSEESPSTEDTDITSNVQNLL